MELTKEVIELICELEYEIGKECYNPNSYNGWTGEEGCSYRYPVNVHTGKPGERRSVPIRSKVSRVVEERTPAIIDSMKYRFGTNHLFVGKGIRNILTALEKRYGISFDELEKKLRDNDA